jgi:hypothetical protein
MKLLCVSKDFFGLWDVTVSIKGKEYTYTICSSYDIDVFNSYLPYHPMKALNWLKKVAISTEKKMQ